MKRFMQITIIFLISSLFSFVSFSETGNIESFTYKVKENDTLRDLAYQFYGYSGNYKLIVNANKDLVADPNIIEKGWELTIPSGEKWLTWNITGINLHPYGYDLNNKYTGLYAELVKEALKSVYVVPKISVMEWDDMRKNLETNQIDFAFAGIGDRDWERFDDYILVELLNIEIVLVSLSESNLTYTSIEDLEPYKIGQIEGYTYCKTYNRSPLHKISFHSNPKLLDGLLKNEVALIIGDRITISYYAKEKGIYDKLTFHNPIETIPSYAMFPSEKYETAKLFYRGLKNIHENGTFEHILSTWN